jgi:hypothetical protein
MERGVLDQRAEQLGEIVGRDRLCAPAGRHAHGGQQAEDGKRPPGATSEAAERLSILRHGRPSTGLSLTRRC